MTSIVKPTRNGPFSDKRPSKELHPGPPFNHSTTGSLAGSFCDSTNLKHSLLKQKTIKSKQPQTCYKLNK